MDFFLGYDDLNKELAAMISNQKYYLRMDQADHDAAREQVIQSSFYYHYSNNEFYRGICEKSGVDPLMVKEHGAERIPLIPVNLFKDQNSHLLLRSYPGFFQ